MLLFPFWNGGMELEGGKIWEEEEDERRESRTERWQTVSAFWVVCSCSWSCVGPDREVLLPSSVNTACYKPFQPIQHRCPTEMDRELSFLSSDDFSSSRTCQVWLYAVKTETFILLLTILERCNHLDFDKPFGSNTSHKLMQNSMCYIPYIITFILQK